MPTIEIGGSPPSSATTSTPSAGSASTTSGIGHPTAPSVGSPSTLAEPPSTTKFIGDYPEGNGSKIVTTCGMPIIELNIIQETNRDHSPLFPLGKSYLIIDLSSMHHSQYGNKFG